MRKEGELLSRTTTTKGDLAKEIETANSLYKEQIGYLKEMYSLRTQRLSVSDGSDQAKQLDAQIQKYGQLIAKSREQANGLSEEARQLSNLNKLGEERAKVIKSYQAALKSESNGDAGLSRMTDEYKRLSEYVRQYNTSLQTGQGTDYWSQRIESSRKLLAQQSEELKKLDLTADRKQKLLDLEQKIANVRTKQPESPAKTDWLAEAQGALQKMQTALSGVGRDKTSKNWEGMLDWAKVGDKAKEAADEAARQAKETGITGDKLENIKNIQRQVNELYSKQNDMLNLAKEALDSIGTKLTQQLATWTTNTLKDMFKDAISYASEYYDLMNEIRIVSGYSEEEAKKLGEEYRKMAREMSVSSTDIAKAAVEFWRQGLDETETNKRVEAATQYAKISSMDFAEAAELITAATNTLDISAQHVADVFAYLGDESASG